MKKKKPAPRVKGTKGHYHLNQHAPRFADRRTRRNRDRSSQERRAIRDSD